MNKYAIVIEETFNLCKMKVTECCNSIVSMLPNEALPLLPSFFIGLLVSSALLIFLVRKETKKPLFDVIKDFFEQLLNIDETVFHQTKVKRLRELHDKVSGRWSAKSFKCSNRISDAVEDYLLQKFDDNRVALNNTPSFTIKCFSSLSFWNKRDILKYEEQIISGSFVKAKKEFQKIFSDYQKGICKRWEKVDLDKNGFSAFYPLISEGVINTINCSSCPSTFQVRRVF